MSTQNEPNIKWKGGSKKTALVFKGHEISLDNLATQAAAIEDASRRLLTEVLLFNHPFFIDIPSLTDDMGNTTSGYSLFTDRVNEPALGYIDQLTRHVLNTPALRSRFILSVKDGEVEWNTIALGTWLTNYAQLDLLCLIQIEMNCGAPPRTTELTAMSRSNTPYGMLRALRIIDGHVILMRTYHKMRAAQGHDHVIPHSLNAALAAIIIYKEAICRPFAQLCASVLYPGNEYVKSLYQNWLFVNISKPFDADNITSEMRKWTRAHLGCELGVRDWRQVSTPLRRTHAGMAEVWLEDQNTVDAAQAGHSHYIDRMRYGVTERSSIGLAEDFIGPFLDTSVRWHNILRLVPGGHFVLHLLVQAHTNIGGRLLSLDAASHRNFQPPAHVDNPPPSHEVNVDAIAEAVIVKMEEKLGSMKQELASQFTANNQVLLTQIGALLNQTIKETPIATTPSSAPLPSASSSALLPPTSSLPLSRPSLPDPVDEYIPVQGVQSIK